MTAPASDDGPRVDRRRHDRADVLSTSILLDLTSVAIDPAYVEAAARRAAGESKPPVTPRWSATLLLAVLGLLAAIAFAETRRGAPEAARVRSGLLARVDALTRQTDAGEDELERLRAQVDADRDDALAASAEDAGLAESLRSLEFSAATTAVRGDGVRLRVGDGPAASGPAARVQDRDLQRIVNIAWSAGAEAVAVNGQRIGPLTAIRQAGESILVDYRPVSSPYELTAVGPQDALERELTVGRSSDAIRAVARSLGFGYDVQRAKGLELAGTAANRLSIARKAAVPTSAERSVSP